MPSSVRLVWMRPWWKEKKTTQKTITDQRKKNGTTKYSESIGGSIWLGSNASANSTCAQRPPPHSPWADPRALAFFLPWMANSQKWGLLSCQIPRGGDKKRPQMPHPPSTLQHFSLIAQSNNVILSILMFSFFVSIINVFLCNSARILTTR